MRKQGAQTRRLGVGRRLLPETEVDRIPEQRSELLGTLKARFEKNMNRHNGLEWAKVQARLEADPEKLWSLGEMERTNGEPDVVGFDKSYAVAGW